MELIETTSTSLSVSTITSGHHRKTPFIEANTIESSLEEMRNEHIIPVFVKDNETLISHVEFIEAAQEAVFDTFKGESVLEPDIRLSHPIKGRIPEAKDKHASELLPWEKTIYYERMAFQIEVPSIRTEIDGNMLSLAIGGVKAYNEDNLYSRSSQSDQHFKLFVGFQNKVCTNLCVWSDGYVDSVAVRGTEMLKASITGLLVRYRAEQHLSAMKRLVEYGLTEEQFAQIIGKCRMYQHLPSYLKRTIPPMPFGDQQMGAVVRDYYRDESFCRDPRGNINLWRLFNLFTGVNKSSYIDSFLERSVNAFSLADELRKALDGRKSWYLS